MSEIFFGEPVCICVISSETRFNRRETWIISTPDLGHFSWNLGKFKQNLSHFPSYLSKFVRYLSKLPPNLSKSPPNLSKFPLILSNFAANFGKFHIAMKKQGPQVKPLFSNQPI